jgi:serine/threonine-protein kinase
VLVSLTLLGLLLATTRIRAAPARVLVTILLLVGFWVVAFVAYGSAGIVMSMMYNTIAIIVGAALSFLRYFFASDENLVESERQSAESNRLLALAFQGQGQLDMAFDKFRAIPVDDRVADLIYNLALDFERKRQFSKAVSVYEYLRDWNANYRDIQQRIGRAAQIEANPMKGSMGGGTMASIVGGEGVEKPMLGRYEVQKELGQGAMGTVYLGEDPKIHRAVAIKTMSLAAEFEGDALADAKERFFREAESAGRLNHPNIVAIYDAGEEHDLAYIAMEFLKGKDLSKNTTADNLLPLEEVLDIGIQCAEALDYAHRMGVVHRDVKPSNMMYDRDTHTVKLTDFGIARITDSSKTRTGTVLGTPNYMSPEQALGDKVDGRSDLFSLGVVLYQLCAGRLPFQGDSMASLMYKIVNDPHPDIKDISATVPGSVRKVIDNALRKQPDKRYQSGAKLAEHLRVCKERLSSTRGSA